jgi:putative membrane protein
VISVRFGASQGVFIEFFYTIDWLFIKIKRRVVLNTDGGRPYSCFSFSSKPKLNGDTPMKTKLKLVASLFFSLSLLSAASFAASESDFDSHFLSKLHKANQDEINAGKLALKRAESPAIRNFGRRMVQDHSKADQQLMVVAKQAGIPIVTPQPMNQDERDDMMKDQKTMAQLQSLNGKDFDKAYRDAMLDDHKKDVQEVTDSIPKLQNSQARDFAKGILPTLETHEEIISSISG